MHTLQLCLNQQESKNQTIQGKDINYVLLIMPHETEENKYRYKLLLEFFPTIHSTYGISHWGKCLYLNRNRWNFLGGNQSVATFIGERVISLNTNNSVYINIYTNLSEPHALSLYQQNELHQISQKEFSFCAKVIIFLIAFMKKKEKHAGKPQKHSQFYEMGALSLTNLFGFCLPVHT